ncbi:MAG: DUF599 domain-containing protein [Paracoccaceae bacterium]
MPIMLPSDFDLLQGIAILSLFGAWSAYSVVLKKIARGSLNAQLSTVRAQWLRLSITRGQKPFDAILLGHIVNSIAFFGSATMIVLAGCITLFANVKSVHGTASELTLTDGSSFELFVIHFTVLTAILALSFFSFTYALRKLIYVLALVGALPEGKLEPHADDCRNEMVRCAAMVLSEALMTFNFGIRGYYYAVAGLGLFVSPWLCLALTFGATAILMYRQIATPTASAVQGYVAVSERASAPPES